MNVVCCQLDIVWENKVANHERVRALLDAGAPPAGALVVLPEMFATGFSMNVARVSDDVTHETQDFLARTAKHYGVHLLAGIVTLAADGRGQNECVAYSPDGVEIVRYRKLHPFTFGGEHEHYAPGDAVRSFACDSFTVAPFICYDLRFPEVFRIGAARGATLFTVIANWLPLRHGHWAALLKARAIENQAYVVGVNRSGADPKFAYRGQSMIVAPNGEILVEAGAAECTISADIDIETLVECRREFPVLDDMRFAPARPEAHELDGRR